VRAIGQADGVHDPTNAVLVLVTGLQGTGKSTIAESLGDRLGAPVFAWDWFLAALTPFESVQEALRALDAPTYRRVGWALVLQTARAQLRRGLSVVLDGLARQEQIEAVRALARELGVPSFVVLTTCDDADVQRARIQDRDRAIPGWHELTWAEVQRTRAAWVPPEDVDLVLDSTAPVATSLAVVSARIGR
jgi:predicted kinase